MLTATHVQYNLDDAYGLYYQPEDRLSRHKYHIIKSDSHNTILPL